VGLWWAFRNTAMNIRAVNEGVKFDKLSDY
jgi:hypothetical protein